jgi:hypothetical protein
LDNHLVNAVTIAKAAREMDVDPSTVQHWLRRGAPTVRPGAVGRGRGALVDIEALRRWRYGALAPAQIDSESLASAMLAAFQRPAEGYGGAPIWAELDLSQRQAAVLWVMLYTPLVRNLTGKAIATADELPPEMRSIYRISLGSL